MVRRLVAVALLFLAVAGAQQPSSRLEVGGRRYTVDGDTLTARAVSSGRVLWTRQTPAKAFRWLGSHGRVLVGTGTESKRYPTGQDETGRNVYTSADFGTVFGLDSGSGRELWRSRTLEAREARLIGRVAVYTLSDSAYAITYTDVLDVATGRMVLSTKGDLAYQDGSHLVFACFSMPVPYCSGWGVASVDRVNVASARAERWKLELPQVEGCMYDEFERAWESSYTATHAEFTVKAVCGLLLYRYTWGAGPGQRPVIRRLGTATPPR